MKLDRNRIFSFMPALALALALALAGCGGGGGTAAGGGDNGMTMPEPDPPLVAAQKAAATAATDAANAVSAVEEIKEHDPASYADAQTAAALAAQANAQAQAATTTAEAQAAQAIAESAASDAAMYADMVTAAKTAADDNVARMAANAVVKSKEDAISTEAGQDAAAAAAAGLGGTATTATGNAEGAYNLDIERDRMATTVTVTVEGATDDADEDFVVDMDLGNGRQMLTRTMDPDADGNVVEEVVVVSTDIEAPTAVEFAKFQVIASAGTVTTPQALDHDLDITVDADEDGDATNDYTALAVDETSADVRGLVKSAAFTAGTGAVLTFDSDNTATTDEDEAYEVAGTYNGAMGTYRCDGTTDCTVTLDAEGAIIAMSDGWIFTPAMDATSDQPDYDYYHYGFWLKKTTDEDGVTTYSEVQTFAGSRLAESGPIASVEGTAMYEGGAVGVYVKNVYNSDRTLDTASSGHFKADVNIMAYFGGGDVAANKQNTIEGTIDNFALSGGEENSWSVALKSSAASTDGTHAGTAKGGGDGDGSFSATFHGSVAAVDGVNPHPSSVVGEFNAMFTDGSVAGAFGARKMME